MGIRNNIISEFYISESFKTGWIEKSTVYLFVKRLFDIMFSGLGLVVVFPTLILIAIIIAATSPGPIVYGHNRIGRYGKFITVYKFRTTYYKLEAGTKPEFTPFGKLLWRTCLQELPMYINVILGDMSIVGPRPLLPREVDNISDKDILIRNSVKPGITGLASISSDYDKSISLDVEYVKQASFLLDLKIIILTVKKVLFSEDSKI